VNTDNFIIESSDIELAQNVCKMITDTSIRNRAVANAIAGSIASKFFDKDSYNVDSESGLHNIGIVLEDIDISDIYINNNYIDVRVFFNEEEISIPEAHFKNNLLPLAYMFIKINEDLSGASVIGFITPENVQKETLVDGCFHISEDSLQSFYDIEILLTNNDELEVSDKDIFAYLDNSLEDKNNFYSELLKSREGRLKLAKAAKAKEIFKFVSVASDSVTEDIQDNDDLIFDAEEDLLLDEDATSLDLIEEIELSTGDGDDFSELDENSEPDNLEIISETEEDLINFEESEDLSIDEISDTEEDIISEISIEAPDNISLEEPVVTSVEPIPTAPIEEKEVEALEIIDDSEIEPEPLNIAEEPVEATSETAENEETEEEKGFEFTTVASPSSNDSDILDELSNEPETESPQSTEEEEEAVAEEQIEALFNTETPTEENTEEISQEIEEYKAENKNKGSMKPVALIAVLIITGALGYFGYTKFFNGGENNGLPDTEMPIDSMPAVSENSQNKVEDAMPIETVETTTPQNIKNEGVAETIPAIEQNLDASILVSNLKVEWEVPSGYASNASAKRYLVKLGKIVQLNLKTELLLLNKPPITNKISVEIKYNSSSRKFEAAGIVVSSGEKMVDDIILQTVNKALAMNLSTNTDSFAKLQGNPVLIIHL